MIHKPLRFQTAIPVIVTGIAVFFAGCQPRMPVKEEVVVVQKMVVDHFAQAEAFQARGARNEALGAYRAYVLEKPDGDRVALAYHRMGDMYASQGERDNALNMYTTVLRRHAEYAGAAAIRLRVAQIYYAAGEYENSRDEAVLWMGLHKGHVLERDVAALLGDNFSAMEDPVSAFSWWEKSKWGYEDDSQQQAALNEKLERVVETSEIETLERLSEISSATEYAPAIYYRLAVSYLETDRFDPAENAVMDLVQSSGDPYWLNRAQALLSRIMDEKSVKKGAVGCLLPLSGPFRIYGEEVLNGILLALDLFGQPGGEPKIELIVRDTGGVPEQARSAFLDLANQEQVMAVVGPLTSRTVEAVAESAETLGVPMIALTQKEEITWGKPMVFRNFLTPSQEINILLDFAIYKRGLQRFGILYPQNAYGRYYMNLFWDGLVKRGAEVRAVEGFPPEETDYAVQIKKMVGLHYPRPASVREQVRAERIVREEGEISDSDDPIPIVDFEAVFIPDNYLRVAMVTPQLVYHDVLDVLLLGTSLWQSPELIGLAGDYVQNCVFPSGFFGESESVEVQAFMENYQTAFDAKPGLLAGTGYDTLMIMKKILENEDLHTRRSIQKAIVQMAAFQGITGVIAFDQEGETTKKPLLLTIKGRRMIPVPD